MWHFWYLALMSLSLLLNLGLVLAKELSDNVIFSSEVIFSEKKLVFATFSQKVTQPLTAIFKRRSFKN